MPSQEVGELRPLWNCLESHWKHIPHCHTLAFPATHYRIWWTLITAYDSPNCTLNCVFTILSYYSMTWIRSPLKLSVSRMPDCKNRPPTVAIGALVPCTKRILGGTQTRFSKARRHISENKDNTLFHDIVIVCTHNTNRWE